MIEPAPRAHPSTGVRSVAELAVAGRVPRFEVPEWRERFGVVAGVTGRGDPDGPGFDLGLGTEQPVAPAMARWREFRQAEPGFTAFVLGQQVHGTQVALSPGAGGWTILDGVDGHATARPGTLLLVTVADCIPVYLVAPRRRAVALLHAGWRGTAGGILGAGVGALRQLGAVPGEIVMHCGVGICGDCYEVGSEVMTACGVGCEGSGPWHLDLRERLARAAGRLGIHELTTSVWCSAHDRDRFFSHRASRGRDGRMLGYLGYPEAGAARIDGRRPLQ